MNTMNKPLTFMIGLGLLTVFSSHGFAQLSSYEAMLNDKQVAIDSVSASFVATDEDSKPLRTMIFYLENGDSIEIADTNPIDHKGKSEFEGLKSPCQEVWGSGSIVYTDSEDNAHSTLTFPHFDVPATLTVNNVAKGGLEGKEVVFVSGVAEGKLMTCTDPFVNDGEPLKVDFKLSFSNVPIPLAKD